MVDSMVEDGPKTVERLQSPNSLSASADIVISDRFNRLAKKRKPLIAKFATKAALTTSAFALIISSGCGNTQQTEPQVTPETTPLSTPVLPIEPTMIVRPTETPKPLEYDYMDVSDDVKVAVDKEGLPVKYIVLSTNEEVYFDKEEMRKLREKAISSKEPEIIKMFLQIKPVLPSKFSYKESNADKHPKTLELSKDIVSEEDLRKRGITILQPENTNLFIREGAFAKGGILEDFNNEERRLNIVFLNGSTITQKYLNDPKYAEIIDYLPKRFLSTSYIRESNIDYAEKTLEFFRREPPDWWLERDQNHRESFFLDLKVNISRYKGENSMTDEQIAKQAIDFLGWYVNKSLLPPTFENTSSFLFLSVDQNSYSSPTIFFRQNGDVSVKNLKQDFRSNLFPATAQTHPDPDDFIMNSYASPENGVYIYDKNAHPGFVLRHEFGHRKLIEGRILGGEEPDFSEYSADKHAMQGIKEAWEKWVNSGYTDNTGYPFVFELPPEAGGGYILTRRKKQKPR